MDVMTAKGALSKIVSVSLAAGVLMVTTPAATPVAASGDDYPYRGTVNVLDRWGFYSGYCTSFVAWRLSQEGVTFHHSTLTGPNGQTRFFGNGGSWDGAARAVGFTVDSTASVGAVAVWHSGEQGAWTTGHVAYVMAVQPNHQAVVEEYNWSTRNRYSTRVTTAPRYIHFVHGAASPSSSGAPAAPAQAPGHPYHVTATLREHSGPGIAFATVGMVKDGSTVLVTCQSRTGSVIKGTSIWDRLSTGAYVTDYYVTTPLFNRYSPGLPHC